MMMKMLEAGGIEPLTDRVREADEDNLGGYYEFEQVKKVTRDSSWLEQARGRAVKVISRLLRDLPPAYAYKVIFMQRDLDEVLASQQQMLLRRGQAGGEISDAEMKRLFIRHLEEVADWLGRQPNFAVLYANYNAILAQPREHSRRIDQFLGGGLEVERMAATVDQQLYRQRAGRPGAHR